MLCEWECPDSLPVLATGQVHVWRLNIDALLPQLSTFNTLLSNAERERARRFHFQQDRERYLLRHAVLRWILGGYLNIDGRLLQFDINKFGRPSLSSVHAESNLDFNISHSEELCLMAFVRWARLGIDVEKIRPDFATVEVAQRFFSPGECRQLVSLPEGQQTQAFFRCWTRKEAYLKAHGEGLSLPLNQFDVSLVPGEPALLLAVHDESIFGVHEPDRWRMWHLEPSEASVGALIVEGQDWELRCLDLHHRID